MACKAAQTRITQVGWYDANTNTGIIVANPNGTSYMALGSLDTVGAVQVACSRPQSNGQSNFVVAAGAPFVGYIAGPFTLLPLYYYLTPITLNVPPVLDVLMFEDLPPVPVGARAPLLVSVTGGAAAYQIGANVRGRKRVLFAISPGLAGTTTYNVGGWLSAAPPVTPPSIANAAQDLVVNVTYAPTTSAVHYEFNAVNGPPTGAYPGLDTLDYLNIGTAAPPGADTGSNIIIQAWD